MGAEVARQRHHAEPVVRSDGGLQRLHRPVDRAVVDDDELEVVVRVRAPPDAEALDESAGVLLLVEDRHDDADEASLGHQVAAAAS